MQVDALLAEALQLQREGRLRDAAERYVKVLAAHPDHPVALHYFGVVRYQSGDPAGAVDLIRRSIHIDQAPAEPWANLAQALDAVGRPEAAVNALKEALRRAPADATIWSNLAVAELKLDRLDDAERSCRKALEVDARLASAWYNLALVLEPQGRILEALDAASRATAIDPSPIAHSGLKAQLQEALGQHDAARKTLVGAIARHPGAAPLHLQLGRVAERMGDLTAAADEYDRALRLDPGNGAALSELLFLRKRLCDWRELGALQARFRSGVGAGQPWLTPFSLLSDPSTRALQKRCGEIWSARFETTDADAPLRPSDSGRLRIGYLSSDFFDHPTAVLAAGLFEQHDRSRFDIVGYSTGPDDGSTFRRRVVQAFDRYFDARSWSVDRLARQIRADRIDILVDLKGHTANAPTAVLARRPAPIQVHFLGYPATTGAPFIDYLVGDAIVTPPEESGDYTEALVRLPGSYQVNDRSRPTSLSPPTRESLGLPHGAVVLCCFNNTFKINPQVIDSWCKILIAVPDAVLWLLARGDGDPAIAHLRREVAGRGVDPQRVVFATHRPQPEYLALYGHADLMLDTWPYNAHTTASDALWCGCPVLTWRGDTFAGRVAASVLTAVGLPELVAPNADRYVEQAIERARHRDGLARYRSYLLGAGRDSALFDVTRFARALEAAFRQMAAQCRKGICEPIDVKEGTS